MKKLLLFLGFVTAIVGSFWGVRAFNTWQINARNAKFNEEIENLFVALQKYKEYVGSYPIGSNAEIGKMLLGQNPKNVIILVGRKNEMSSQGEFVDPWGTPLKIYFSNAGVLIRSAGPNRRFDDSSALNGDDVFRSN
ncbi:MAG TPA: hypothetical protein DCM86_01230 [Verrucomicrobiales bacterium]|nr:hypothetical protein [Verrucomicrobiales bacterium]